MRLYFIQINHADGPIKIGVAKNVDQRLSDLQTANPYELKLLAVIPCKSKSNAYSLEKFLHRKFKHAHIRGEWFEHYIEAAIPQLLTAGMDYITAPSRKEKKDRYTEYQITLG